MTERVKRRRRPPSSINPSASPVDCVRELFDYAAARGISAGAISEATGIHVVTLSHWRTGYSVPRGHDLDQLARFLGGSLAFVHDPLPEQEPVRRVFRKVRFAGDDRS